MVSCRLAPSSTSLGTSSTHAAYSSPVGSLSLAARRPSSGDSRAITRMHGSSSPRFRCEGQPNTLPAFGYRRIPDESGMTMGQRLDYHQEVLKSLDTLVDHLRLEHETERKERIAEQQQMSRELRTSIEGVDQVYRELATGGLQLRIWSVAGLIAGILLRRLRLRSRVGSSARDRPPRSAVDGGGVDRLRGCAQRCPVRTENQPDEGLTMVRRARLHRLDTTGGPGDWCSSSGARGTSPPSRRVVSAARTAFEARNFTVRAHDSVGSSSRFANRDADKRRTKDLEYLI